MNDAILGSSSMTSIRMRISLADGYAVLLDGLPTLEMRYRADFRGGLDYSPKKSGLLFSKIFASGSVSDFQCAPLSSQNGLSCDCVFSPFNVPKWLRRHIVCLAFSKRPMAVTWLTTLKIYLRCCFNWNLRRVKIIGSIRRARR